MILARFRPERDEVLDVLLLPMPDPDTRALAHQHSPSHTSAAMARRSERRDAQVVPDRPVATARVRKFLDLIQMRGAAGRSQDSSKWAAPPSLHAASKRLSRVHSRAPPSTMTEPSSCTSTALSSLPQS